MYTLSNFSLAREQRLRHVRILRIDYWNDRTLRNSAILRTTVQVAGENGYGVRFGASARESQMNLRAADQLQFLLVLFAAFVIAPRQEKYQIFRLTRLFMYGALLRVRARSAISLFLRGVFATVNRLHPLALTRLRIWLPSYMSRIFCASCPHAFRS